MIVRLLNSTLRMTSSVSATQSDAPVGSGNMAWGEYKLVAVAAPPSMLTAPAAVTMHWACTGCESIAKIRSDSRRGMVLGSRNNKYEHDAGMVTPRQPKEREFLLPRGLVRRRQVQIKFAGAP